MDMKSRRFAVPRTNVRFFRIILPACIFFYSYSYGQSATNTSRPYAVGQINISGNKKTKRYIIERELSFRTGDSISLQDLVAAFKTAHDRLINTHLFNEVVIYLKNFRGYKADIEIEVKERWYI